jgi:hypothetical protein
MTSGGHTAKKKGRPPAGEERTNRETRATRMAAEGRTPPAAGTVKRGRQYETIFAEWRGGRDQASIAARHDKLGERRVREIIDELRAGEIESLRLNDPWAGHRYADDLMLRRVTALDDAAEAVMRAKESGNASELLAALKYRDQTLTQLTTLLQDTGRLPRNLGWLQAEVDGVQLVDRILVVFEKYSVPDEVGRAVTALIELETRRGPNGGLELDLDPGDPGAGM